MARILLMWVRLSCLSVAVAASACDDSQRALLIVGCLCPANSCNIRNVFANAAVPAQKLIFTFGLRVPLRVWPAVDASRGLLLVMIRGVVTGGLRRVIEACEER